MKPIKLKMQAFGSYGQETVIDFTKPSQNLFLITGDTGSGKSTIFDAIVFALYGSASAVVEAKEGVELQSQFVSSNITPYVELTFSENRGGVEQQYRIRRQPFHKRPKMRGKGESDVKEQVELFRPDGTHTSTDVNKNGKENNLVNKEIAEIVGLTKAQFMQVAMIAQGDFVRLIRADTATRQEIFRKIFDTGIYKKIIQVLAERYKDASDQNACTKKDIQIEVNKTIIPERYSDSSEIEAMKKRILINEHWSPVELEEYISALEALCRFLCKEYEEASKQKKNTEKQRDDARNEYAKATALLKTFEQLEKAQKTLLECSEQESDIKQKDKLKSDIQKAYEISGVYELLEKAQKELAASEQQLQKLFKELPGLKKNEEEAATAQEHAKEELLKEKEAFSRLDESVKKARALFSKINDALSSEENAGKQEQSARKALKRAEKELSDFATQLQKSKEEQESLLGIETQLAEIQREIDKIDQVSKYLNAAEEAEAARSKQKKALEQAQKKYEEAKAAYQTKNDTFMVLRNAFYDAQAGILAATLVDGTPCPVCGSCTHPAPCQRTTEHQDLTREDIEQMNKEVEDANKKQSKAAEKAHAAQELLQEKESQLEKQIADLSEALAKAGIVFTEPIDLKQVAKTIISRIQDVDGQKEILESKKQRYEELTKQIVVAVQTQQKLQDQQSKKKQRYDEAHEEFVKATAARTELEKQKEYQSEQEAELLLANAQSAYLEAEKKSKAAAIAMENAKTKCDKAEERIRALQEQTLPKQHSEIEKLHIKYQSTMEKLDLPECEWKGIVEHHKKEEAEQIEKEVIAFHDKKTRAEGSAKSAQAAVGDQPKPDILLLKEKKEKLEALYEESDKKYAEIAGFYKDNSQIHDNLTQQMQAQKMELKKYYRIKNLFDKLNGKESGNKIDIETMVQRMYLERILYAANRRFLEMSSGQFELRLMDKEKSTQKDRGLDLMVYSNVTGSEREIRMLSGGESFMAALALALGMSDQIQQNSASVNLDIMFIDEGFGSLDAYSRNQAIKVLKSMAGGSRMIGLISHVTELKQQIDDKLVVEIDRSGSHAHWVAS